MKIAFIIQNYNYHGGGQVTASLAKNFQSLGHKVDIVVIRCSEGDFESRPSNFSNIIDLNAFGLFSSVLKLTKIFRNSNYDIFISIGSYSNLAGGLAKFLSRSKTKIIGSEHFGKSVLLGDYLKPILRLSLPLYKFAYTHLNGLIFVSNELKLEFLKKNSWHPSRCSTIFNPVRSFKKKNKNLINKDSGITFLGMGVLEPRKRFDLLLKSFSMIAKPSDILLIAGTGPQKHMLENLAKKLKIESQVRFLGYVQDVNKLMNNSDILVLTSSSEALPMVLLEGLATGLQVVSTNSFSGPSEVLGNGRYGFLAEVNNLKSIVSSMRAAIDTPISQEIIFEGATRFSTDNIVNQYLKFIEKIIKDEGNLYAPIKPKLVPERKLRKKVLINISVITPIYRGMSVFTKQIIKKLIKNGNYDFIFVSGNELDQEIFRLIIDSNSTYKQINAPLPIFDQIVVPYLINKFKPNFCWFPANTFPLILNNKSKYIVTVHDLIFLMDQYKVPSFYQKIAKYYRVLNIFIGIKRVEKITSVSRTTMSDLYAKFKISKKIDNQEVFYNTLHIEEDEDNNIFKKLSIDPADKFFYSIVGPGKHKNVDFLIESFKRVQKIKNNYKLVISGILNSEFKKESNDIIFTPFISEKEKTSLIKNAELFIFPSLAEGFGIPLLEGLYHNSKVLVSDIPIFREIGKSHVRYFDPYDKNFLIKYLKDDIQKSNHEEAKNYILKKFDVSKSVNKLEKIFAKIE